MVGGRIGFVVLTVLPEGGPSGAGASIGAVTHGRRGSGSTPALPRICLPHGFSGQAALHSAE